MTEHLILRNAQGEQYRICGPHGHVKPCVICDLSPLGGGPVPTLLPIHPCRHCAAVPTAPLGEFCPASDPSDLDFHDFSLDGAASAPPAGASPGAAPSTPLGVEA